MGLLTFDSEIGKDFLEMCKGQLLHVTDALIEGDIKPSGAPGYQMNSPDELPPRPGCVYLSCPDARGSVGGRYVLIIDALRLDPTLFRVDEDRFVAAYTWHNRLYQPTDKVPDAMRHRDTASKILDGSIYDPKWFNDVTDQLDTPEQVLRSLSEGSVAYYGAVPSSAILKCIDRAENCSEANSFFGNPELCERATLLNEKYRWN